MDAYLRNIRKYIGNKKIIHPAARIIVENEMNEILVIQRKDNGNIGIPAGSLEENETIEECIKREVWEETGLKIMELHLIGISSNPSLESVQYPNGDQVQYFTIEFYSNVWEGQINITDTNEVKEAAFKPIDIIRHLPKNERATFDSWAYFKKNGRIRLG